MDTTARETRNISPDPACMGHLGWNIPKNKGKIHLV